MIRPLTLLPVLVVAFGVVTFGVAMAQSNSNGSNNAASTTPSVKSTYCVCASSAAPDPQDCYPANRQGKRDLIDHSRSR